MVFREGTFIKANHNGKEVSGYVLFDENSEAFITGNNKLKVAKLSNIRLSEGSADSDDIDEIVNNDLDRLDADKVKNMKDKDVEKVSQAREKELTSAGIKIKKGDYAEKLTAGMKAMGVFSKVAKGDITMSDALKKYESTNMTDWSSFRESDLMADSDQMYGDTETVNTNTTSDPSSSDPFADIASAGTDASTDDSMNIDLTSGAKPDSTNALDGFLDSSNEVKDDYLGSNDLSSSEEDVLDSSITANPADSDITDLKLDSKIDLDKDDDDDSDLDLGLNDDNDLDLDNDFEDYSDNDVEIKIKNPRNNPIEIKIDSAAEDAINDDIDAELDKFESGSPDFDEAAFLEHICKKYRISSRSRVIREATSIEDALCRVIDIVAANN